MPWEHLNPRYSQAATLRKGLSLTIAWGSLVVVAVVALVVTSGNDLVGHGIALVLAGALAVAGLVTRQRPWGPWLSLAGLATIVVIGLVSPGTRFDVLVMGTYTVAFLTIFITPRSWGLVAVACGTVAMCVVALRSQTVIEIGQVPLNVGFIAVIQMVVAGLWLWAAWHRAIDQAQRRDTMAAEQEHAIEASLTLQERTRAWRDAITRTHETILNDLRYVLRTPNVDRDRLREQLLTTRDRRADPPASHANLAESLAQGFTGKVTVQDLTGETGSAWSVPLQPILLEVVRNIARHTDARHIAVRAERAGGDYRITIDDDGTNDPGEWARALPGIGRSVVVEDALSEIGAHLDQSAHRSVITLSLGRRSSGSGGRVLLALLSIVLASSTLGGSIQFVLLLIGASSTYLVVAAAALLLTAMSVVTVVREQLVGLAVLTPAAVLAAAVPWGLVLAQPVCATPPLVLTTINLSLNAFFAMLLWARSRWSWILVAPAFIGVLGLGLLPGVACPIPGGDVLLSSAVLVPILIVVSWLSARSAARWEEQDQRRWETDIAEAARTEAEVDLARGLDDSIDLAWMSMWEIAEGAALDDDRRRRLRTVDSLIRSSLQVDPRTAGGVLLAAHEIVARATAAGVPLHVRSLRGSADERPISAALIDELVRMVVRDVEADVSIHVFCDDQDDYLTVTVPAVSAARVGFVPGWDDSRDGCLIEVEYVGDHPDTAAEVTVIVSRAIQLSDLAPAPQAAVVG